MINNLKNNKMKKIYYFIIITVFFLSCKSKSEKLYESISGTWKLDRMEYQDSTGLKKVINDSYITLTFLVDNYKSSNSGFQVVGQDTMYFEYFIYSDSGDLDFKESDIEKMPIGAIGRMQVYNFDKMDNNSIEFSADVEVNVADENSLVLKNTSYLYTKIGE
jgi:hypothetical protein